MEIAIDIIIAIVAFLHILFLVLEMFLWDKSYGRKVFNLTKQDAETMKALAANQGLYNGFLAAGLIWGLIMDQTEVKIFFLSCVIVAGIFGAATVNKKIFFIQALPAILALLLIFMK